MPKFMKLRMSLARRLVPQSTDSRQGVPAIEPFSSVNYGPGLSTQPAPDILLREAVGMVDAAQRAIANRLASLTIQVKRRRMRSEGTEDDEILDDHPLALRLRKPHPDFTTRMMLRLTAQWLTSNGEAYWFKKGRAEGFRVAMQLNPMSPVNITPLVDKDHVSGYRVIDADGKQLRFDREEFVRIYFPDPESPFRPEGYLGPAAVVADAHKFATQHLRMHFQNDATPKIALEAQEGAQPFASKEERNLFYALWKHMFSTRKGEYFGAPPLLPVHWKLVQIAMQNGMEITPLLDYFRDDLLMGFGVPKSVLGMVTSGDRSSAETNQYVFDTHTVLPISQMLADALTDQLAVDYDDADEIFVDFAPFVGKDKDFVLAQEVSDLEHGVRTINQVLRDRGCDAVPWGDKPTIIAKVGPYDPNKPAAAPTTASDGVPLDDDDEASDEDLRKAAHRAQRIRRIHNKRRNRKQGNGQVA